MQRKKIPSFRWKDYSRTSISSHSSTPNSFSNCRSFKILTLEKILFGFFPDVYIHFSSDMKNSSRCNLFNTRERQFQKCCTINSSSSKFQKNSKYLKLINLFRSNSNNTLTCTKFFETIATIVLLRHSSVLVNRNLLRVLSTVLNRCDLILECFSQSCQV